MKASLKKVRRIRKAIKKTFLLLLKGSVLIFLLALLILYYPDIEQYFKRFTSASIDTSEIDAYYDLLTAHKRPGKNLVLELNLKEEESLQVAIDRLRTIMGLNNYVVGFAYHDEEKPPAYIRMEGDRSTIFVSTKFKDRREEINMLVHEMSHIYVWKLDPSVFGKCDQEKLVDCSGIFLGLGVLTLNGFTDKSTLSLGGGVETQKNLFGYLKPEQFGYLLARYCAEQHISDKAVRQSLNPAGCKYFTIGRDYLKKKLNTGIVSRSSTGTSTFRRYLDIAHNKLSDLVDK